MMVAKNFDFWRFVYCDPNLEGDQNFVASLLFELEKSFSKNKTYSLPILEQTHTYTVFCVIKKGCNLD